MGLFGLDIKTKQQRRVLYIETAELYFKLGAHTANPSLTLEEIQHLWRQAREEIVLRHYDNDFGRWLEAQE